MANLLEAPRELQLPHTTFYMDVVATWCERLVEALGADALIIETRLNLARIEQLKATG